MRSPVVALVCAMANLACGGGGAGGSPDVGVVLDSFVAPDGPKPWLRDSGACVPGQSGASGGCGASGVSGGRRDGAVQVDQSPSDVLPADQATPDLMPPDQCVPPLSCEVRFSLPVQGSEASAAVEGDFVSEGASPWTSEAMVRDGSTWRAAPVLPDGRKLTYKLVLDKGLAGEKWFLDPNNPNTENGPFGPNSVLVVDCPNPCP